MYPENRDQILEGINKLNDTMSKIIASKDKETDVTPEVFDIRCKTIKQMIIEVDNSLGDLRDMLDTMEHYQDERYEESVKLINDLENNAAILVDYLRSVGKY